MRVGGWVRANPRVKGVSQEFGLGCGSSSQSGGVRGVKGDVRARVRDKRRAEGGDEVVRAIVRPFFCREFLPPARESPEADGGRKGTRNGP